MTTSNLPSNSKSIKICSVEGCERKHTAKGFCKMHHKRFKRRGTVELLTFPTVCKIEDCSRQGKITKGLCHLHYIRLWQHGNTETVLLNQGKGNTPAERFWSRVAITANPEKCWEWQGSLSGNGYGQVMINKICFHTHIAVWYFIYGKKPTKHILHSCDNRKCVNPNHLREGTQLENMQDKVSRDRQAKGSKVGTSKLKENEVLEIKKLLRQGTANQTLASMFNVSVDAIRKIKDGIYWKHIRE